MSFEKVFLSLKIRIKTLDFLSFFIGKTIYGVVLYSLVRFSRGDIEKDPITVFTPERQTAHGQSDPSSKKC